MELNPLNNGARPIYEERGVVIAETTPETSVHDRFAVWRVDGNRNCHGGFYTNSLWLAVANFMLRVDRHGFRTELENLLEDLR